MNKSMLALSLISLVTACGKKDDRKAAGDDSTTAATSGSVDTLNVTQDAALSQEAVQSLTDESFEALSAQEDTAAASLALDDLDLTKSKTFERECALDGSNAKVTLKADFDRSVDRTTRAGHISWSREDSGTTDRTRLWSRMQNGQAVPVLCSADNKYAKIDWKDVEGLNLAVNFSADRHHFWEVKNNAKGTSVSRDVHSHAEGKRNVAWKSVVANADATIEIRNKEITSNVTRTLKIKKASGEEVNMNLSVITKDGAPLEVAVERKKSDYSLVSKTVQTGVIVGTFSDKGRLETSFDNFKVNYSTGTCAATSGSITYSFFKVGETTASKVYKLTIDASGDSTLTDVNTGTVMEDFELNGCDPTDAEQ